MSFPIEKQCLKRQAVSRSPRSRKAQPPSSHATSGRLSWRTGVFLLAILSLTSVAPPVHMHSGAKQETALLAQPFAQAVSRKQKFTYPPRSLPAVRLSIPYKGDITLLDVPRINSMFAGRYAARSRKDEFVFLSPDQSLQVRTQGIVQSSDAHHTALVALDPRTGKILALAEKSRSLPTVTGHAHFPAASLIKILTTSAALEKQKLSPHSTIRFRGGTYTLNKYNYKPDRRRDNREMSLSEALGKSCNPAFARVALQNLTETDLKRTLLRFGFNQSLPLDMFIPKSEGRIPQDSYGLARTAAGFGDVFISPIHAAALMGALANDGVMQRPFLVEEVISPAGQLVFRAHPQAISRVSSPGTAKTLLRMLEDTTTVGTARKEFAKRRVNKLKNISVAAKTGTLRGTNPRGLNNWFIAAAPIKNPKVAIAVIINSPNKGHTSASELGRKFLEHFFSSERKKPQTRRASLKEFEA